VGPLLDGLHWLTCWSRCLPKRSFSNRSSSYKHLGPVLAWLILLYSMFTTTPLGW
jgi:hypothetical protein